MVVAFGGDEVSGLVFDMGSNTCKIGYSGEESPKFVFPSLVGDYEDSYMTDTKKSNFVGESQIYHWRPHLDVRSPFKDGLVDDWNALEALWDHAYHKCLGANPSEHPLLYTEPAWNPKEIREKLIELAFEKYQVPGFFLGRNPVLSAFASGKATALVIESGAAATSVVPVHDGYILKKGLQFQNLAGDAVSEQIISYFDKLNLPIVPQYLVERKSATEPGKPAVYSKFEQRENETTESFHQMSVKRVAHEFKETVCQVAEMPFNINFVNRKAAKNFEFPNGYNNMFRAERFQIPEILFDPRYLSQNENQSNASNFAPLIGLVRNAINNVDVDLRAMLLTNIVLTGGTTSMAGFADRLYAEFASQNAKIKIHSPASSAEKKFSVWNGGSILSSLGTFHQLWISKQQYDEMGVSVEKMLH